MQAFQKGNLRIKFLSLILRSSSVEIAELPPMGQPCIQLQILLGQNLSFSTTICSCIDAWVQLCQGINLNVSNSTQDKLVIYLNLNQTYLGGAQFNLPVFEATSQQFNFKSVKLFNANGQEAGEANIIVDWEPITEGFLDRMSQKIDKSLDKLSQTKTVQKFSNAATKAAVKSEQFLTKGYQKLKQKFSKKKKNEQGDQNQIIESEFPIGQNVEEQKAVETNVQTSMPQENQPQKQLESNLYPQVPESQQQKQDESSHTTSEPQNKEQKQEDQISSPTPAVEEVQPGKDQ